MIKFLPVIILISMIACSSSKSIDNQVEAITIKKLECWLNLMPGGRPTFHYSGEIEINEIKPENITLEYIEFLNEHKVINKSFPLYEILKVDSVENQKALKMNFYSPQRIDVTDDMLKTEFIDVRMIFRIDDEIIEMIQTDIQLLRTY
jgi:hypothetical protein